MRKNKIKLLINGMGSDNWIGGLYYKRNIIYSLVSNDRISEQVLITVITEKENVHLFAPLSDKITVKSISYKNQFEHITRFMVKSVLCGAQFIYPQFGKWQRLLPSKGVHWIADFQHNCLPELFSQERYDARTRSFQRIAMSKNPLVLSSQSCLADFREYYSTEKENVYVVPFVSYILPELESMTPLMEERILEKFKLSGKKYIAVFNQFWKHKNHIVIFDAIKKILEVNPDFDCTFVFTGAMKEFQGPEYLKKLKKIAEDPGVGKYIEILGFIDRIEQLALMKNAAYIIQPSLFEGWGTVVEDAKVLDKTILLSDIPIHREQKNDKCILFDPYNSEQLADLILQENKKQHIDDMAAGIADMQKRAKEYSKGFEQLLLDAGVLKG